MLLSEQHGGRQSILVFVTDESRTSERRPKLPTKNLARGCVLIILADGFDEIDVVTTLSVLRQAGMCARSVGIARGLVNGAHGIQLSPDLTLAGLDPLPATLLVSAAIVPEGRRQRLTWLETEPRLHRLLCSVAGQGGWIAVSHAGWRILKAIRSKTGKNNEFQASIFVRQPGQPADVFARDLIQRFGPSLRT